MDYTTLKKKSRDILGIFVVPVVLECIIKVQLLRNPPFFREVLPTFTSVVTYFCSMFTFDLTLIQVINLVETSIRTVVTDFGFEKTQHTHEKE